MGCIYELLKATAGLIGMGLMLAGLAGLGVGVIAVLSSGEYVGVGVAAIVGGILVMAIATILGKWSRGDYD